MTVEHSQGRDADGSDRLLLALGTVTVAVLSLAAVLRFGGALQPPVPTLTRPGALTTIGLPIAKLAMNAAGTITVGWLLMVVVFLPAGGSGLPGAGRRCLRAAALTSAAWALAALALAVFSTSELTGRPVTGLASGTELLSYLTDLAQGRALLAVAVIAAVLSVASSLPRTPGGAGYPLVLAILGLLPPVFTGHSMSAMGDHTLAVFSLAVHVVGAAVWVGGLIVLLSIGARLADLPEIVPRYSRLALVCFAAVGASGLINAWVRLGGFHLGSRYGVLVVLKVAALAALAALGWWHRRSSIPALRDQRRGRTFVRLAAVEVVIMAAAMALATGLSRTPPPLRAPPLETSADVLLGFPLPGPPGLSAYILDWYLDPLPFALVLAGTVLYAAAVVRLRRGGTRWPVSRTLAWFSGLAIVLVATCGGLGRYSMVLFSAHVVQHLALGTLAPILLLLGTPVTLALRALPSAATAGRAPRELLAAVPHSRLMRLLAHPVVAPAMFVAGLHGLYFSPVFEASMRDHTIHSLTMVFFVVTGLLFLWPVIGGGPGPQRPRPVTRFALVLCVLAFHAFLGTRIMMSDGVLAQDWYAALGRDWGSAPLHDQRLGGRLAWGIGTISVLLIMLVLARRRTRGEVPANAPDGD